MIDWFVLYIFCCFCVEKKRLVNTSDEEFDGIETSYSVPTDFLNHWEQGCEILHRCENLRILYQQLFDLICVFYSLCIRHTDNNFIHFSLDFLLYNKFMQFKRFAKNILFFVNFLLIDNIPHNMELLLNLPDQSSGKTRTFEPITIKGWIF